VLATAVDTWATLWIRSIASRIIAESSLTAGGVMEAAKVFFRKGVSSTIAQGGSFQSGKKPHGDVLDENLRYCRGFRSPFDYY
jgi:hypothetical protein